MTEGKPLAAPRVLETAADYLSMARSIEAAADPSLKPWRVAVLSSFTAEPLKPYLVVDAARFGLACNTWFGPFNQFEQQAMLETSELYAHKPDAVVLAMRLEDVAPGLFAGIADRAAIEAIVSEVAARIEGLLREIRSRSAARLLVFNFAPPVLSPAGLADGMLEPSFSFALERLNAAVAVLCKKVPDSYVFDLHRVALQTGLAKWQDKKMLFLARMPFGADALRAITGQLARTFNALVKPPKKCLVLDLDGTLWGGVVGEEGAQGVGLGEDYPGNAFKAFHRYLLTLRARGVLLAIASKNNPADAIEVFETNPDCLLKLSDFSSVQIGWQEKSESLQAIAAELNIGKDSLVFFDDNPKEREFIRYAVPEATVIETPKSPMSYIDSIEDSGLFDVLVLSDEDRQRAELYRQEKDRVSFQQAAVSLPDFLRGLTMRARCGWPGAATLPRMAQLTQKTNQFNTTTRRYTAAELAAVVDGGGVVLWQRLEDRFGDNGLVGMLVAKPERDGRWIIENLLLSCRVIGRGAENLLLHEASRLIAARGGREIIGLFLPSKKNVPAKDAYADVGFSLSETVGDEGRWRWDIARDGLVPAPDYIVAEFEEAAHA